MLKIGNLAKDLITGYSGVVVAYAQHLHNCDRAGIQPQELKDGSPADVHWFDAPQVEYVGESTVPVTPPEYTPVKLGDMVADTLSSLVGTVTVINTWINGCVRLGVSTGKLEKNLPVDEAWLPASQVKLVTATPPAPEVKKPGGPMRAPQKAKAPR